MPYSVEKTGKGKYRVINSQTGKVHAKGTSRRNADAQVRLMLASEHGWKPKGKKKGGS